MTSCGLCQDFSHEGLRQAWNEPLIESPNFVVLPSLGALIEGWLLLVPKKHFICMGALPRTLAVELQAMKTCLCSALRQTHEHVCVFEHGPSKANLNIGCGVDHAHLHFLPAAFDLATAVAPFLPADTLWSQAQIEECQEAFYRGNDYLYLEQPIGAGRIATHRAFGSQLFRRAIASQIGATNQFNWREYPQLPNVHATINMVRAWDGGMFPCMTRPKVAA
jgi:diadenosine tetraphosphate (Ap4A) HIT family hydrolase